MKKKTHNNRIEELEQKLCSEMPSSENVGFETQEITGMDWPIKSKQNLREKYTDLYKIEQDEEIEALYENIKPVVRFDDLKEQSDDERRDLYFIKDVNLYNIAYAWDPKPTKKAENLEKLADIQTKHTWAYHGFFKPSIAEVLVQIPQKYINDVSAFEIKSDTVAITGNYHTVLTRLYKTKENNNKKKIIRHIITDKDSNGQERPIKTSKNQSTNIFPNKIYELMEQKLEEPSEYFQIVEALDTIRNDTKLQKFISEYAQKNKIKEIYWGIYGHECCDGPYQLKHISIWKSPRALNKRPFSAEIYPAEIYIGPDLNCKIAPIFLRTSHNIRTNIRKIIKEGEEFYLKVDSFSQKKESLINTGIFNNLKKEEFFKGLEKSIQEIINFKL
ncbi:MAG: hypothetical protein ABIC91_00995 [Nanoarchaeota archaeon]|nr:hypothetical protein [Nanoarchaeota archaeon]MBU1030928.1 hypothetical protein [Nanoarchaeota archaeon]MBU1850469.1 hypothetical protein [Nanoarchaeota archaeon]